MTTTYKRYAVVTKARCGPGGIRCPCCGGIRGTVQQNKRLARRGLRHLEEALTRKQPLTD